MRFISNTDFIDVSLSIFVSSMIVAINYKQLIGQIDHVTGNWARDWCDKVMNNKMDAAIGTNCSSHCGQYRLEQNINDILEI